MNTLQKIFLFCFIFIIMMSNLAQSACINTGDGVWTTDGNESDDVNECIAAAAAGDTIHVVAGDGAATWAGSSVNIPVNKPVNLIGPGRNNLKIHLGGHYVIKIAPYIGTAEVPATRISGFSFESPLMKKYCAIFASGQVWRIDNCKYESIEDATSITTGPFVIPSGMNATMHPYGVIDNNIVINGKIVTGGPFNFDHMSASWVEPLGLGTGNAVYIEDNTFSTNFEINHRKRLAADSNFAGRYVFRYNTVTQCDLLTHGLQADNGRGTRRFECYGNDFNSLDGSYTSDVMVLKAGTGMAFFNADTSPDPSQAFDNFIKLQHERSDKSIGTYAGMCEENSHWDGSNDSTGWPCRDQIGVGTDAYKWSSLPQDNVAPPQTLTPFYFWSNVSRSGTVPAPVVFGDGVTHIKENRDYYAHNPSFDGTSGVGCGTLGDRPATCTPGVGYWATSQSCSDMDGMIGPSPSTPIDGVLYQCTAVNTWTKYYEPYTYPHPLRTGTSPLPPAPPVPSAPSAPENLRYELLQN